jgi:hypothetical protein
MESDRIAIIEDCPKPKSIRDVQVLLVFANFHLQFIREYAKVTLLLSELLRTTEIVHTLKAPERHLGSPKNLY